MAKVSFKSIQARAARRKGGPKALASLMPKKPNPPRPFAPTVPKVACNPVRPPLKPHPAVKPFKPVARTPLPKW